jgi:hypothetical protein
MSSLVPASISLVLRPPVCLLDTTASVEAPSNNPQSLLLVASNNLLKDGF